MPSYVSDGFTVYEIGRSDIPGKRFIAIDAKDAARQFAMDRWYREPFGDEEIRVGVWTETNMEWRYFLVSLDVEPGFFAEEVAEPPPDAEPTPGGTGGE